MSPHAVEPQTNGHRSREDQADDVYDLICIGFGPASLAIAIALHDTLDSRQPLPDLNNVRRQPPRVLYLERQQSFGWHSGMLLPGTKMQISFVKDLATMRDPRSHFTFLNYLHHKNRLAQFTNLDTFLPQRVEYADYLSWCASHFDDVVQYGQEVIQVSSTKTQSQGGLVDSWHITARDAKSRTTKSFTSRNIVLAMGGAPQIPQPFPQQHPRVIHSSSYAHCISKVLADPSAHYNVAVVGSGQSAAECFHDLHSRFPNSRTRLLIRGDALKPSDDSPFVNEIFDADQVSTFYTSTASQRAATISGNRATNYGVVRGVLLQEIYDELYIQRLHQPDEKKWQHRIEKYREVFEAQASDDGVKLVVQDVNKSTRDTLRFDAVVVAAGYKRDMHERILEPVRELTANREHFAVRRDYSVEMDGQKVSRDAGIWLQGCNERSHGLADTLLSILAVRGGEMVQSIFGDERYSRCA